MGCSESDPGHSLPGALGSRELELRQLGVHRKPVHVPRRASGGGGRPSALEHAVERTLVNAAGVRSGVAEPTAPPGGFRPQCAVLSTACHSFVGADGSPSGGSFPRAGVFAAAGRRELRGVGDPCLTGTDTALARARTRSPRSRAGNRRDVARAAGGREPRVATGRNDGTGPIDRPA